ncbi:MAG: phenylacetic acid degradation protein PaaN [Ottowia sp.]|nr:phenylacetic acid degradation protein PaaN [Ottowia sp.]
MNWFEQHHSMLNDALEAVASREYCTVFSESPLSKAYGESAQAQGIAAVQALCGCDYPLQQPGERTRVATESSPYGVQLGIRYPDCAPESLVAAGVAAQPQWLKIGVEGRMGILLEGLARLNQRSHEIAHAVMLTTGQGANMAFQAGGPHAQERALEALAYAWKAMTDVPGQASWEKPNGKNAPHKLQKHFTIVGRGVGLVVGCSTFPTWNCYPGLFASLATGNATIVKPHPNAVLPAAITVSILRDVIAEQGLDPNILTLSVSTDERTTQALATHAAVTSIDYTGGNEFGRWLYAHAKQARIYAEMAGVNSIIVESTDNYEGMLRNLAFTLSLYSGQMCTTPQNIYVPRTGIATDKGNKTFEQFGQDLAHAVEQLLSDPKTACAVLGAICSSQTLDRLQAAQNVGRVVLRSRFVSHSDFPKAKICTPAIIALEQTDKNIYEKECFGPVTYLIATASADAAVELAEAVSCRCGAITLGVYSTDTVFLSCAIAASERAKVALSINLTQGVYINQSASFSDYHASGANPAANASYTTLAFVADRFVVVQRREHTPT